MLDKVQRKFLNYTYKMRIPVNTINYDQLEKTEYWLTETQKGLCGYYILYQGPMQLPRVTPKMLFLFST